MGGLVTEVVVMKGGGGTVGVSCGVHNYDIGLDWG